MTESPMPKANQTPSPEKIEEIKKWARSEEGKKKLEATRIKALKEAEDFEESCRISPEDLHYPFTI